MRVEEFHGFCCSAYINRMIIRRKMRFERQVTCIEGVINEHGKPGRKEAGREGRVRKEGSKEGERTRERGRRKKEEGRKEAKKEGRKEGKKGKI